MSGPFLRYYVAARAIIVLAALSFLLYARAVVSLHEYMHSTYDAEIGQCVPAAISHVAHGAPLGFIDRDILKIFDQARSRGADWRPAALQQAVADAVHARIPVVETLQPVNDGNGVGCFLFATVAMWMFGPRLAALAYGFLSFVALSTAIFLVRYRDARAIVVPILFSALTVMLLAPLTTAQFNLNLAPIGGIRYFGLAAVLPALHLYFELTDRDVHMQRASAGMKGLVLAVPQAFLLMGAIFVRNSALYLLGPLVFGSCLAIYTSRRNRMALSNVFRKVVAVVVTMLLLVIVVRAWLPAWYSQSDRVFGIVWHRAMISFGVNPSWPFPGVHERYRCAAMPHSPGRVMAGLLDANGACIWWAYATAHHVPMGQILSSVYDAQYETVMRKTFFQTIHRYPWAAFQTFFYYKPRLVRDTLLNYLDLNLRNRLIASLAVSQLLIVTSGAVANGVARASRRIDVLVRPLLLFFLSALPAYIIAWVNPFDGTDLGLYEFAAVALSLGMVVEYVTRRAGGLLATPVGGGGHRSASQFSKE